MLSAVLYLLGHFNPRAPRGARRYVSCAIPACLAFQSTRSARSATQFHGPLLLIRTISIHALREERDITRVMVGSGKVISIHALREERDGFGPLAIRPLRISIHALREERDITVKILDQGVIQFQSTRSARSATLYYEPIICFVGHISIHALREERDLIS